MCQPDSRPSRAFICPPLLFSLAPDALTALPAQPGPALSCLLPLPAEGDGEMAEFPDFGVRRFGFHPQLKAFLRSPEGPRSSWGGSAVGDRAGSAGSRDLELPRLCFAIPFNRAQRERSYLYKIKQPRSVSLVQCLLESHLLPSGDSARLQRFAEGSVITSPLLQPGWCCSTGIFLVEAQTRGSSRDEAPSASPQLRGCQEVTRVSPGHHLALGWC